MTNGGLMFCLVVLAFLVITACLQAALGQMRKQPARRSDAECRTDCVHAVLLMLGAVGVLIIGIKDYATRNIIRFLQDEIRDAYDQQLTQHTQTNESETTRWLNSVLGAAWALINPDLFRGFSDTLQEVTQAAIPKLACMVNIEDIGKGNESIFWVFDVCQQNLQAKLYLQMGTSHQATILLDSVEDRHRHLCIPIPAIRKPCQRLNSLRKK
jgi:hypothetical protein